VFTSSIDGWVQAFFRKTLLFVNKKKQKNFMTWRFAFPRPAARSGRGAAIS
jgi:hypothetical protein